MDNKITATAHDISVGADNGQSPSVTKHTNSITDNNCARNLQSTGTPVGENLETVSMEELYDTVYPIKKPLVEDLIYNGVYLFVGAPKVGKSFLMAEIGFCVSAGIDLWGHKTNQEQCCIWHWKMIMQDFNRDFQECLELMWQSIFTSPHVPKISMKVWKNSLKRFLWLMLIQDL